MMYPEKQTYIHIALLLQYSGIIDEIQGKRNEWGADIVALLTSDAVSGCGGVAYVGPSNSYMYSVTLQRYGAAVFAHEVGKLYSALSSCLLVCVYMLYLYLMWHISL